jgi:hypothetical protein
MRPSLRSRCIGLCLTASLAAPFSDSAWADIAILAGDDQSTVAGGGIPFAPLRVRVSDANGAPLAGVVVTFAASASGPGLVFGGASTASATTDSLGEASSPPGTANTGAGYFNVVATLAGDVASAVFVLLNVQGAPLCPPVRPVPNDVRLSTSPNPSVPGQAVVIEAGVRARGYGFVGFLDGRTVLGNAPIDSSGVANLATSSLAVGSHPISARFPGDCLWEQSTSPFVEQRVLPVAAVAGIPALSDAALVLLSLAMAGVALALLAEARARQRSCQ